MWFARPSRRSGPALLFFLVLALTACAGDPAPVVSDSVHAFYYGWYATEAVDGGTAHWDHEILPFWNEARRHEFPIGKFPGGDDIGANYWPRLGTHSSRDPAVVRQHLAWCVDAGIGVLVVSWWGAGSPEESALDVMLEHAPDYGVKVAFHLEPFRGRAVVTAREAIVHLLEKYGGHEAIYRPEEFGGRPVFYVYDSYHVPAADWARLLKPGGDLTIRGTKHDVVAIGLWVGDKGEREEFPRSGFDGFTTYFASTGFTEGSTPANWPELAAFAREHDLVFIPSVGPGYVDTRIRPWNAGTTRDREAGAYYDRMFRAALDTGAGIISITSFNEWHEGTQIEPAVPKSIPGYEYEDYEPLSPTAYLERTRRWVDEFMRTKRSR